MRVLQINAVYGMGSTGVIVEDIHQLCLKNGIDSYVAYSSSNRSNREIPNGYRIGGTFGKKIHAVLCRINGMQGYYSRHATRNLINHIKTIKPDLVHLHNLHSNYIHLNMLLRFLAEEHIQTVVTLHDCWFYTGGCFHYTAAGCDKWLQNCGACPKKKADTPAYFADRSSKILEDRKRYFAAIPDLTVIGVSKWITEEATKTVFKGVNTQTVYNGIDTELFKPTPSDFRTQYGLDDQFILLGPASKWLSAINKEVFNTMVSQLKENEVLVLLGCKTAEGLPEKVLPLPYIHSREELCKVYSAADVFVNPTREESLSLINVEAQACGTPVVTFANTGVKETVDGSCGFAAEPGDCSDMLRLVRAIKETGKEAYASDCRQWVRSVFDKNTNYRTLIDLYQNIIQE